MTDKEFKKWYKNTYSRKFSGEIINNLSQLEKYGFDVIYANLSNDQAEPRRSVLRQNIDKNPSQLVIPPLAPAPLLGVLSSMLGVYKEYKNSNNKYTFALREAIYTIMLELPKKYRPKNVPDECNSVS